MRLSIVFSKKVEKFFNFFYKFFHARAYAYILYGSLVKVFLHILTKATKIVTIFSPKNAYYKEL